MRTTLVRLLQRRMLGLSAAVTASGVLLLMPAPAQKPSSAPVSAAIAWPKAQTDTIPATLPDGTTYKPIYFLDIHTSIGTAPSPDGKFLRLLRRNRDATLREMRRLPRNKNPYFGNVTAVGDVLAWAENTGSGNPRLWTVNLRDVRPPRQVTADTGNATLNDSQYSLTIADGRLHWVAADPSRVDATQVRSVALTGGPVVSRPQSGTWELSTWPWLVNGATKPGGTTRVQNLVTKKEIEVRHSSGLGTTSCSPTWCRVLGLSSNGDTHIDLVRPDGSARKRIAGDLALPAINDVVPLNRFEVVLQPGPNQDLTRNAQLLVFEIAGQRTIQLSGDAANVFYADGVLWWSNGTQEAVNWHALDLRTVQGSQPGRTRSAS